MTSFAAAQSSPGTGESFREARVEDLLGRKLRDADGRTLGRIEEMVAEFRGPELVLIEVHAGRGALLERLVELSTVVPLLGAVQRRFGRRLRVPWEQLDLSDLDHPRTTVRHSQLNYTADPTS
jgi:hypothetical protein